MTNIETIEDIIKVLEDNIGETFVFHYICTECEDEQVSYEMESDEELIENMKKNNMVICSYECTNCNHVELYLTEDNIYGVEILK
jgi:hypothetical protein